ncbi:MAG: hypothetical protein FWD42_05805 [Solirubrobacterales bacterium]|nr:hypothetical protein [Solirubrobacterales bacterium]
MTVNSPLYSPHRHRHLHARREERRAHVRRQRVVAAALTGLFALVLIALAVGGGGPAEGRRGAQLAAHTRRPVVARSAIGLPMGHPALALRYLSPRSQPVGVPMRQPPRAGLLFNLQTGQVLWQLRPSERVRIASLTKMMTAWLAVHALPAHAQVPITRQAVEMPGSKVGVLPLGRRALVETLMYGLLLPSGNDAAVALAQGVAGSLRHFVADMNREAAHLGLGCTRYSSPSGYYNLDNYSCAADLAVLAHDDLLQPRIASIVREPTAAPPLPIAGGRVYLYNNNPLLIYHYPGVTGMKTGYTLAAGKCLVATAERHGVRLGVVLLHSPYPGTQARRLLNAGFAFYHVPPVREPPMPPGV